MQAGRRDLERAAEALATRIPEPLGVLARLAYNYRWSWDPDGPDVYRAVDPDRWERVAENPVKLLQEAADRAARRRLPGRGAARARRGAGGARQRRPRAPRTTRARPARSARSRTSPPSTASTARSRSTRAASARSPATSSRRPPTAPGRWPRSACCTATATSASGSTPAAGSTSTGSTPTRTACPTALVTRRRRHADHGHRPGRRRRGRVPDLAHRRRPRAAVPARRRPAGELRDGALDHEPPVHRRRGHAARAVHAARHRRRARARGDGDRAEHRAPQRGPRGVRLARARAARVQRQRLAVRRAGDRPPAHGLHHPHAGPGRQRHLPGAPGRGRAQPHRGHARRLARGDHQPRPHEPGRGGRAVRRHPVRAAHEPRRQRRVSRRHGEVAREMWHAMWADARGRRRPDHPRHQRRPHPDLARHADVGAAQPPSRRGLAGPRDRPGDLGAGRRHPGQGALGRPPRAARAADRVRAPPRGRRPARARRAARLRRGRRRVQPGRADGRLRPPPGHLQAAEPAAAGRRAGDAGRRRRPARAGAAGRQGAPARRGRQEARPGPVPDEERARASPPASRTSTTTTCGWPRTWSAAATSGSTSRARRWRPAARPG